MAPETLKNDMNEEKEDEWEVSTLERRLVSERVSFELT